MAKTGKLETKAKVHNLVKHVYPKAIENITLLMEYRRLSF